MTKDATTPAALIEAAGIALYGAEWVAPMARDLDVDPRTLRAWRSGKLTLAADHGVLRDTLRLLETRAREADKVAARIAELIDDAGS